MIFRNEFVINCLSVFLFSLSPFLRTTWPFGWPLSMFYNGFLDILRLAATKCCPLVPLQNCAHVSTILTLRGNCCFAVLSVSGISSPMARGRKWWNSWRTRYVRHLNTLYAGHTLSEFISGVNVSVGVNSTPASVLSVTPTPKINSIFFDTYPLTPVLTPV